MWPQNVTFFLTPPSEGSGLGRLKQMSDHSDSQMDMEYYKDQLQRATHAPYQKVF